MINMTTAINNMTNISSSSCALDTGVILDGFCATEIPIEIDKPRSIRSVGPSTMLVLERGTESVVSLFDTDGDGMPDNKTILVTAPSLNHGLAIHDGFLYASSDSTVYRWPFDVDDYEWNNGTTHDTLDDEEIVVVNINEDGRGGAPQGHRTRTLEFDKMGTLYITVGSDGNVDPDSYRSRIRRTEISRHQDFLVPLDFQTLEVFMDGLRNTVGLAFDSHGVLWGVENGADNLQREDLGGDITEDNAEELNRFREEDAGSHFGYPYCWTEFSLPEPYGTGTGSVWAWPDFIDQNFTDEECQAEYVAPIVSMQAHSAPLGIVFYQWSSESSIECLAVEPFPRWMDGYAFVAYHGSWNRQVPTGYKVVYIAMDEKGEAIGPPTDLLAHQPPDANWEDGFRPVDVDFDDCGRLLVTSDGTGRSGSKIVRIEWEGSESEAPSDTPTEVEATTTNPPTNHSSSSPSQVTDGRIDSDSFSQPSGISMDSSDSPSPFGQPPSTNPSSSGITTRWHQTSIPTLLLLVQSML